MKIEITPVVVIPDMSPLIHLAAAGQLSLLQEFGRVVVIDIVAYEASADLTRPWACEVAAWLKKGPEPGNNQPVEIVKTEIGEAYRLARLADPEFKMRDAGERAIRDWLVETLPELGGPALVIYEDKRMPGLIQREHLEQVVVVATTRGPRLRAGARPDRVGGGRMERHHRTGAGREPESKRDGHPSDSHTLSVLQRYAAGEISSRQAAKEMGPKASEHDVFAGILAAHLRLPAPADEDIAREVAALRALYGPHGPRP